MARAAKRPTRRSLRELADELGYSPGEYSIRAMAGTVERLREWRRILELRQVPADLMGMGLDEARDVYERETADLRAQELKWANYFHPTLKGVEAEVSGKGGGPVRFVLDGLSGDDD